MDQEPNTKRTQVVEETRQPVETTQQNRAVSKAAQIIWFIVGVIVTILLVRAVLALLGANLENDIASFVYAISEPFVAPFRGLLQVGEFQAGVARLELETLIAALVYALIGWGLVKLVALGRK